MGERPHTDPPTDSLTTLGEAERDAALRRFEALRPHIQDGVALAEPGIGHVALNADRVYIFYACFATAETLSSVSRPKASSWCASGGHTTSSEKARSPWSCHIRRRPSRSARLGASHGKSAGSEEGGMHYVAVIDKDPDSAYGIQFPEVPGCFSAADTFEEIVPNAIEALSLFFEDSEPVSARGLEVVRERVAENIAQGAVLMMIPYVQDRKRVVRVNLSLEKGFLDTMDEAARMRGMTRSAFVQKAATREILDPV